MSHYIYRKKAFLKTPDDRVLPLVCVADSSLTSYNWRTGREYHQASWMIDNMDYPGLLVPIDTFRANVEKRIKREMDSYQEYKNAYESGNPVTWNDATYYGNTYPTGSTFKAMRSFFSSGRCLDADQQVKIHPFTFWIDTYDPNTYESNNDRREIYVNSLEALYEADKMYVEFKLTHPGASFVVDVVGLSEDDCFRRADRKIA